MTHEETGSTTGAASSRAAAGGAARKSASRFFLVASLAAAVVAAVGFGPFYLRGQAYPGRDIPPPIKALVVGHGVAMTAWLALMIAQSALVLTGRRKAHMALGKFGVVLAAVIVAEGLRLAVRSTEIAPPGTVIWGLSAPRFMAVPFVSVILFGACVAAAIVLRRRPPVHRALMLTATIAALSAAMSRIDALNALYLGTWAEAAFGPFFLTLVFAVVLCAARAAAERTLDRPLACGVALLIAVDAGIMKLAATDAWDRFAAALLA